MIAHSFKVNVPDQHPYDRQENWFLTFVGHNVQPLVNSQPIGRFWFTNYGAVGSKKHALFRFEASDVSAIADAFSELLRETGLSIDESIEYDVTGDLGCGEKSRMFGTNAQDTNHSQRGDLVFTFLHASACLLLDCLVGPDNGYFNLEEEKQSGFSKESPFEQYHHLFCNMTRVPTYLAIAIDSQSGHCDPITYEEFKFLSGDTQYNLGSLRRSEF